MATPDDDIWEWDDSGIPDKRPDRGRTYYKRVSVRRRNSNRKRYFRVGDPVVMSGDDGQVWIAQIVNLFQAQENDIHIKELMRNSTARNEDERRYELMRCTLRWFYNIADMNHHTLNTSRAPKPIPDEIWFSDHVEQDGFNDVQVIEGRAWLFSSVQAKQAFVKDPDPLYDRRKDKLRVVRCFVDSKSDHLPVRELERTELERLLRNPSTDKDLYENSRLRLYGSAGAVLKGTGKKKRRHSTIRSPVNVDEDEFEPTPRKKSRVHAVEAKTELGLKDADETERTKGRSVRRRKVIDNEDDDESSLSKPTNDMDDPMDEDTEPLTNRIQALDQQQRADARRIERENEEVYAWVTELNDNAYKGDPDDNRRPLSHKKGLSKKLSRSAEVSEIALVQKPGSSRQQGKEAGKQLKEHKARRRETETIVIDDDGDTLELASRKTQRPKVPPPRPDKKHGTSRQPRHTATGKSSFTGKPFMPTQRARKPPSTPVAKNMPPPNVSRIGTTPPQKRTSEAGVTRHSLEKASTTSKKLGEKAHTRKDIPQSSTRQEKTAGHHGRPADREFLVEITTAMDKMKLDLAKMPSESKSVLKGKIGWLVDSVIDKMFDGRKERANDLGDSEVRKIVDLTLTELQGLYVGGLKGSKNVDRSRSGMVET